MPAMRAILLLGALSMASGGCTLEPFEPTVDDPTRDATVSADAGRSDAGRADAGRADAGRADAGRGDAGRDAAIADAASCVAPEVCNGIDDDCDPATADGADEPTLGDPCDGADADMCADGAFQCTGGVEVCTDDAATTDEMCNATDDDCDGLIDESVCSCPVVSIGASTYAFCRTNRLSWANARLACTAFGYDLVTIEDATENAALAAEVLARDLEDAWIGLNDQTTEGTFEWSSGSPAAYRNWIPDQPSGTLHEDCTQIVNGDAGAVPGQWNDARCVEDRYFICEVP